MTYINTKWEEIDNPRQAKYTVIDENDEVIYLTISGDQDRYQKVAISDLLKNFKRVPMFEIPDIESRNIILEATETNKYGVYDNGDYSWNLFDVEAGDQWRVVGMIHDTWLILEPTDEQHEKYGLAPDIKIDKNFDLCDAWKLVE